MDGPKPSSDAAASPQTPHLIKIVVVGDGAVGKTTLLLRHVENRFPETYVPTVFENYYSEVVVDGIPVNMGLWDTAGQEDFDRLRSLSYNDTNLVLIVYSVDSPSSLANVQSKWVPEVKHHVKDAPYILVGTKADLRKDEHTLEKLRARNQKIVELDVAAATAKEIGAHCVMECSALTGVGVKEIFDEALKVVLTKQGLIKSKSKSKAGTSNECCTIL
uniref:Uncharacterized protein n=1 Tax=Spongospora subterranea TaxID=70186 RepID=A0A0H5RM95_9EUKA|eukprot:CRZ09839.1 hypothetical protein [Spongospora subterranea]